MNTTESPGEVTTQELPLFPLGLVLFPGARLPLKVFEQRYVDMTKTCLRDNAPFGVCLIRHGSEVGAPAEHETIGCSAHIIDWEMPHPGLFHLDCRGDKPFRVVSAQTERTGLIVGEVEWLECNDDEPVDPEHTDICRNAVQRFIAHAGKNCFGPDIDPDNPEWVSYRLAEVLAIDPNRKQALLEQCSTARRLATLSELLQPG